MFGVLDPLPGEGLGRLERRIFFFSALDQGLAASANEVQIARATLHGLPVDLAGGGIITHDFVGAAEFFQDLDVHGFTRHGALQQPGGPGVFAVLVGLQAGRERIPR